MKIITRNEIYNWYCDEMKQEKRIMIAIFNSITDEQLVNEFKLIPLSKGKFYKI